MDDFFNITIRNVSGCAQHGINISEPMKNVLIENVNTFGPNRIGVRFRENFACENFVLRNLNVDGFPGELQCAVYMEPNEDRKLDDFHIERVRVANQARYILAGDMVDVKDLAYVEPAEGFHTPEKPEIIMSYGRYYRDFNGVEIQNRPVDNRFDGTLRDFTYLIEL